MRIPPAVPTMLVLVLLLGAAGCSEVSDGDADPALAPTPTTSPVPSPVPSPAPSSAPSKEPPTPSSTPDPKSGPPPFTTDVRPSDGGQGSGNGLGVIGVRTAQHRDYDRVVFDMGGTGDLGWYADYTTNPRYEGSGDPVMLEGTVFLQVFIRGVGMPFDTGLSPFGDDTTRVPGTGTEAIAEIAPGGVVEGEQQALIGLTGVRQPFRVFALADPVRLVVDVSHG